MDSISAFILYLTVFRLSIIFTGIVSIILGYRLFCNGTAPGFGTGAGTTVDANFGEHRFKLQNAAPGTCFALFGVVIISVMIFAGSPELTLNLINGYSQEKSSSGGGEDKHQMTLSLRGGEGEEACGLTAAIKKGRYYEERGELDNAILAYQEGLALVGLPLNYLAWLYHTRGDDTKALPLARMATQLLPEEANCLDTLAEIEFDAGAYAEALSLMEKAAGINPIFREKLGRFRAANQDRRSMPD
ncbi:hypothetical protein [Desulfoluna sp.]|uniref:hypothetical protein n=1 Tax=Desulfoluna sp. TaxID=2045199 RepID=UPI00263624E8|nr:hypothetical protein [Desulfoluna sp.]